jgi:crotonobetainyl-CoA:carnitine CoA-transferase CaiB-like acyl-CoA transferase
MDNACSTSEFLLSPYRILDLTDEKGLLCGKILADLGADVIKVERPGGDAARHIGPFYHDIPDPEKSLFWFAYNTNKRSITLNIEIADGRDIFRELVSSADFVIESFAPGYMQDLGLSYAELSKVNPAIILTSITPFGQAGPYKNYKGSDIVCMAMGGLMYICGDSDRPPVRITAEQAYCQGGVHAAWGSLVAHYYRKATGEGQHVDISIQECILWTTNYLWQDWYYGERFFKRSGNRSERAGASWRSVFPCKDGLVMFRVGTGANLGPGQARFVKMLDEEGMAGALKGVDWSNMDMWNASQTDIELWEEITLKYFANYTKAELLEKALKWDFMCVPVNSPKDIVEYRQLAARDFWEGVKYPELGTTINHPGAFCKFTGAKLPKKRRPPLIGEHNEDIYKKELGFSNEQLVTLKESNII